MNVNINKKGILTAEDQIIEFGLSNLTFKGFNNYISGSYTLSNGIYTINSPVVSSNWGSGVHLKDHILPYGTYYRVTIEVKVPSAHTLVIDINNKVPNGVSWSGNDHDVQRTATTFNIPANTWTIITWGSANLSTSNTGYWDLAVYDGIGLKTSGDSAAISWQIQNPKYQLGSIINTTEGIFNKASITKTGHIYANEFYED